MESTKQDGTDDLDAALQEMGLFTPSPSRPPFPGPPSLLLPSPPQAMPRGHARPPPLSLMNYPPLSEMLVPTASPHTRLPPPQPLLGAWQYWPQPPPQRYRVEENSQGAGYVSPVGSCFPSSVYASHLDVHGPRFNAPATPATQLVALKSSELSASARDYRPTALSRASVAQSSTMLNSSAKPYYPTAPSHHSVVLSSSTPNASQGQTFVSNHQPGAGAVLSAWHDNGSLLALEESSEHMDGVLEKGFEAARLKMLAVVKRNVHCIMRIREGHVVFLELLRACEGRFDELKDIVQAAAASKGNGLLMMVTQQSHGEIALKELIKVVMPYPQLCLPLIVNLLLERLMEQSSGALWLHHFFTTMRYEYSKIIIRFAIKTFDILCSSEFGLKCLGECFVNARNGELDMLEEMILSRISLIAKSDFRFHFLQRVFECGSKHLKERIVERVVEDLMSLSMHQNGHFVVEECFLRMGSLPLLQRMLTVFMGLSDDHLAELVQDRYGCYVVHRLLKSGKDHFPEQTTTLARRIEKLPAAALEKMHAWRRILVL